jgi:hypothetical protein
MLRFALALSACLFSAPHWSAGAAFGDDAISFERDVAPILEQRCLRCHGEHEPKGKLSLATRADALRGGESGAAIEPVKPAESLLLEMVGGKTPAMPAEGEPLTADELAALEKWIAAGAPWPGELVLEARAPLNRDWWSLQPVVRPELPAVKNEAWPRNAIDRFILEKLEAEGLTPSPEADRRTLLRRLSLNLWGLPPSPEQMEKFLGDDDPEAYERLVDSYLGSIHFGERFAPHWLDLVRFAETNGFEMNQERPNAWPYRDYVIRAFQNDLPYDRFLREQIAGDLLGADEATGFLVAGPWDQVKSPDPVLTANQRADELHDMVSTIGAAMLGLTVGCARCHDHKFDPIPQVDYYALKAIVEGVQHGEREVKSPENDERSQELTKLRKEEAAITARLQAFEPLASPRKVIVLHSQDRRTEQLVKTEGVQPYSVGTGRGQKGCRGDQRSLPTIGNGYLYWHKVRGKDVVAWSPGVAGDHRIWVSWGCGWNTHAEEAIYLLDLDGDLATRDDQRELGRANHRRFADGSGDEPGQPLWSGLFDLGVRELRAESKLVLRAAESDEYLSADVAVFEPVEASASAGKSPSLRPPVTRGTNVDRFEPVEARFLRFTVLATNQFEPCLDELEAFAAGSGENVALAERGVKATASGTYPNAAIHKLEHIHDGRFGNEFSWISNEVGGGWVQLEFPTAVKIDRVVWGRDQSPMPVYADRVATEYRIEVSSDGQSWQSVASSDDRLPFETPLPGRLPHASDDDNAQLTALLERQTAIEQALAQLAIPVKAYSGQMTSPAATHRFHRGDPTQPREAIAPGALSAIVASFEFPENASEQQRRAALADWITSKENPLTARVIANRVWQWHFGEGLVDTSSDFGANGARPTHPELLDFLAAELMEHDWSLRHLHRLIATSATYRQSSRLNADALARDAGTRWLWRYPPRRLEAEALRDSILSVSGSLDLAPGGPSVSPFEPNANYVRVYAPKTSFAPADFRRSVYMTKVRMHVDPTFGAFDCPDGGQSAAKRTRSTTPLQALNLLNSPLLLDQAERFADRLKREAGDDAAAQVARAFASAYSRAPSDEEGSACHQVIEQHGLLILCRAILNSNEFVFIE